MSVLGKVAVALGDVPDIELNKTFASVAADLRYVPGGHYSLAECQPYATPPQRDERGRFVKKGQAS